MAEYLTDMPEKSQQLLGHLKAIEASEKCIEKSAISGSPLNGLAKANILEAAQALVEYLSLQPPPTDEKTEFLTGALQVRLESMSRQLNYSKEVPLSEALAELSRQIKANVPRTLSP